MAKLDLNNLKENAKVKIADVAEKSKVVAGKGIEKAKEGFDAVAEQVSDTKYEIDMKLINPITKQQLEAFEYNIPSLIQLVESDRKMDNPVCADALGFQETIKGKTLLCVLNKHIDDTGINFEPCIDENFYCKNPYIDNEYIRLDDYFSYIEKAKVNELELIAQSLGAKKVKIVFKKQKKTLVSNAAQVNAKIKLPFGKKDGANANINHNAKSNEYGDIKIASELNFKGKATPAEPELIYFKGNSDIISLIKMRLSSDNPISSKTFEFECGSGKELQHKDAMGIDAVLEKKGFAGNASIVSEVQEEQRKVLEYSIEF